MSHVPCTVTQDGWVMVESPDKTWSTGEGNGKPLQYSIILAFHTGAVAAWVQEGLEELSHIGQEGLQ